MNNQIRYFEKDVWVTDTVFHYSEQELPLKEIQKIGINFRVVTTVSCFLSFLFLLGALIYCYFKFGDWVIYGILLLMVACFGLMRYMLSHYVELLVWTQDGKMMKTVVTSMHNRHWAYDLEEYLCLQIGQEMPSTVGSDSSENLHF